MNITLFPFTLSFIKIDIDFLSLVNSKVANFSKLEDTAVLYYSTLWLLSEFTVKLGSTNPIFSFNTFKAASVGKPCLSTLFLSYFQINLDSLHKAIH